MVQSIYFMLLTTSRVSENIYITEFKQLPYLYMASYITRVEFHSSVTLLAHIKIYLEKSEISNQNINDRGILV